MVRSIVGTLLALVASFAAPTSQPSNATKPGRPIVIFIHGRDQIAKENKDLETEWFGAFRSGMQSAGLGALIEPADYTLVTYQLLYRGSTAPACPLDELRKTARLDPLRAAKEAKLNAWGITGRRLRDLGYPTVGIASGSTPKWDRASASEEVNGLMDRHQSEAEAAYVAELEIEAAEKALEFEEAKEDFSFREATLKAWDKFREALTASLANQPAVQRSVRQFVLQDTERYLTRRPYRCATNAKLEVALQNAKDAKRPVVVVAHSMGTLVAFDLLQSIDRANNLGNRDRLYDVRRFVSMGTQLGIETFMREFGGFPPKFSVPKSIATWVNIRGNDDYVSPARVNGLYEELPGAAFAEYSIPTTVGSPHDISGYLRNAGTAHAIAFAWCQGFAAGSRPAACNAVKDMSVGVGQATIAR